MEMHLNERYTSTCYVVHFETIFCKSWNVVRCHGEPFVAMNKISTNTLCFQKSTSRVWVASDTCLPASAYSINKSSSSQLSHMHRVSGNRAVGNQFFSDICQLTLYLLMDLLLCLFSMGTRNTEEQAIKEVAYLRFFASGTKIYSARHHTGIGDVAYLSSACSIDFAMLFTWTSLRVCLSKYFP